MVRFNSIEIWLNWKAAKFCQGRYFLGHVSFTDRLCSAVSPFIKARNDKQLNQPTASTPAPWCTLKLHFTARDHATLYLPLMVYAVRGFDVMKASGAEAGLINNRQQKMHFFFTLRFGLNVGLCVPC